MARIAEQELSRLTSGVIQNILGYQTKEGRAKQELDGELGCALRSLPQLYPKIAVGFQTNHLLSLCLSFFRR